ncbi:Hypothetical predicted protein [Cloeon dipterum]|uniref:SOCS box domain-containing protein n=1 Tax=Cloeon dipterum TaxID=197152 RepID=A0A8S1C0E5_9INSE|nr:Hypothetical predicted protein [Cloeon dipterum]
MAETTDDVFAQDGMHSMGSMPSEHNWGAQGIFSSISSEASDEVAEDSMANDYLSARLDEETRQRRPSRAPIEVSGRDGVWSANEVARELRALAEGLWDLASRGEEKKLVDMVMTEGINSPVANTTLLIAAWHGLTGLTHKLLAEGASSNTCDPKGRTPLHLACCAGADDCVALLIKFGADVSSWDSCHKSTPLHCAAGAASQASVKLLLNAGASPNTGLSGHSASRSALHLAVQAASPDCVRLLLDAGAAPNTTQLFTETPLHLAAALGAADCMRLLLQSGADVRVQQTSFEECRQIRKN